jgi:hypothetical protein
MTARQICSAISALCIALFFNSASNAAALAYADLDVTLSISRATFFDQFDFQDLGGAVLPPPLIILIGSNSQAEAEPAVSNIAVGGPARLDTVILSYHAGPVISATEVNPIEPFSPLAFAEVTGRSPTLDIINNFFGPINITAELHYSDLLLTVGDPGFRESAFVNFNLYQIVDGTTELLTSFSDSIGSNASSSFDEIINFNFSLPGLSERQFFITSGVSATAVPEPSSLLLSITTLALSIVFIFYTRGVGKMDRGSF